MRCPRNKVYLTSGGSLTIEGDYKMECLKSDCKDFPCDYYSKHRENASKFEE